MTSDVQRGYNSEVVASANDIIAQKNMKFNR